MRYLLFTSDAEPRTVAAATPVDDTFEPDSNFVYEARTAGWLVHILEVTDPSPFPTETMENGQFLYSMLMPATPTP